MRGDVITFVAPVNVPDNDNFFEWHKRMKEALALSMDEELPEAYFQRSKDMRPPLNLDK